MFKTLICLLWMLRNSVFLPHLVVQQLRWPVHKMSAHIHMLCTKHIVLCNKPVSSLTSLVHVLYPWTDLNPKQHVPLEEYAANLKSMIQYLKSVDITEDRIILITPPPLQESAWEKECLAKGKSDADGQSFSILLAECKFLIAGWEVIRFMLVPDRRQSCSLSWWKKGQVVGLLKSFWISLCSNYKLISNILLKVLFELFVHRTDRSVCPLGMQVVLRCPRQTTSCPRSSQNNLNYGRNSGIVCLRKIYNSHNVFAIYLDKEEYPSQVYFKFTPPSPRIS